MQALFGPLLSDFLYVSVVFSTIFLFDLVDSDPLAPASTHAENGIPRRQAEIAQDAEGVLVAIVFDPAAQAAEIEQITGREFEGVVCPVCPRSPAVDLEQMAQWSIAAYRVDLPRDVHQYAAALLLVNQRFVIAYTDTWVAASGPEVTW